MEILNEPCKGDSLQAYRYIKAEETSQIEEIREYLKAHSQQILFTSAVKGLSRSDCSETLCNQYKRN